MDKITVGLVFVGSQGQVWQQSFLVEQGFSIRALLDLSGWFCSPSDPELAQIATWLAQTADDTPPNHRQWYVGVFSQKKPLGYRLQAGERVELYRLLPQDPMRQRQGRVKR